MRLVTAIAASIALAGCVSDAEARSGLGLGHREAVSSGVDTAASRPGAASGITAESRYGHGIVSGPVRESARGRCRTGQQFMRRSKQTGPAL